MYQESAKKTIELDFAILEIFDDFLISTVKEGVVFDTPHLEQLNEIFALYYPNRSFGYIANRQNDYTVNPICYSRYSKLGQLVGMAVLCHNERSYQTALFTKPFFGKSYEAFYDLQECKSWIQNLLNSSD